MSAWTDGKVHVVVGPHGLSVHRGDKVELVLANEQLGGPLTPKKGKAGFARLRPLAVAGGTKVAYTITKDRNLVRAALKVGGEVLSYPWQISALAPAPDGKVFAAYVTGTKARAQTSLVIGLPPPDPKGDWELEFEASKPQKVDWPEELLWEKAPWSRKTRWATNPDLLHVDANDHGYTVFDTASAVVGVVRKGAEEFACVLRTPKEKGLNVAATATDKGVLVATCKSSGEAVLCHFDLEGKVIARRELSAKKIHPLTVAGGRVFALVDDAKLVTMKLGDLEDEAAVELGGEHPASQVYLRPAPDGKSFLLAIAETILQGQLADEGWTLTEFDLAKVPAPGKAHKAEIAEAEIPEVEEPTNAAGKPIDLRPRIITQAPRLSLNPHQPNAAWTFKAGDPFEIVINAVSVGGPAEAAETGLYVEVTGEALEKGYVDVEAVSAEQGWADPEVVDPPPPETAKKSAEFEVKGKKRLAKLPTYMVCAGVEPIKDKKVKPKERFLENPDDTFVVIRLRGQAKQAGSGLLFVRVGFEKLGQEGSLMRGRPVTVSGS